MDLSRRLAKVADLVLPAVTLTDVGCDHGYLSVYLVQSKRCEKVIAMDINKGPLQKARENILRYGCGDYIETRLSDGLRKLNEGEAQGCVCAGMGGSLALQILWNDRDKVKNMAQVILQPQSELWLVRRTLKKWGFVIEKEDMEFEDGKYYFMMRICPGDHLCMDASPDENDSLFGTCLSDETEEVVRVISEECIANAAYEMFSKELLEGRHPLLKEYILKEMKRLTEVYEALCRQEDSVKCQKRKEHIETELAVCGFALGLYEE
ncbi:MAG: SAM-dependent methyltransferase [Lachnospiraceae bacterium]|nr:SAM-dependent methyltransferase [Lachnospiraceae bacterium]